MNETHRVETSGYVAVSVLPVKSPRRPLPRRDVKNSFVSGVVPNAKPMPSANACAGLGVEV
jgi:hypothetical protein